MGRDSTERSQTERPTEAVAPPSYRTRHRLQTAQDGRGASETGQPVTPYQGDGKRARWAGYSLSRGIKARKARHRGSRDGGTCSARWRVPASAYLFVKNYISEKNIKGNLKIWTAGHSRGAATANMLGGFFAGAGDDYLGNGV